MIKIAGRLFCIAALLMAFSTVSSAADTAEVAALHAADSAWEKAYNGGDVEGVVRLYDADAVLLPPGAPPAHGRDAIRAYFAEAVAESGEAGVRFILHETPVGGVCGSWGWSSGTYVAKDESGAVVETGKYLSVSRKVDGKWLYVRDTWNADGPVSAAEPETSPEE